MAKRKPHGVWTMASDDTYKYFRVEARELLESLTRGVLDLEKGKTSKDLVGRLLRHAHTLKGAARIVGQDRISHLSHSVEDLLAPHREGTPLPPERINELLRLMDAMAAGVSDLGPAAQPEVVPEREAAMPGRDSPPRPAEEAPETVRVEISDLDAFLHEAAQASVSLTALQPAVTTLDRALRLAGVLLEQTGPASAGNGHPRRSTQSAEELHLLLRQLRQGLVTATQKVQRHLGSVQERAGELRLRPASTVFAALERVARDAGKSLGKPVEFQAHGGEHRIDADVLRAVRDALGHIIRNAVAHGIEAQSERRAAGKPPHGQVQLRVERQGNRVVFACQDDGRGIDIAQVRQAARERGLLSASEAAALDAAGAIRLLQQGGVTTSRRLTPLAGRGVGLDVVRETIASLKGEWSLRSEASRGTTVTLVVPISLEAISVLEVEVAGSVISMPFDAVIAGQRVAAEAIARSAQGDAIVHDGKTVPFVPLASLLRPGSSPSPQPRFWSVVLVEADEKLAAIGVDRLLGRTNVVMRPLPRLTGPVELVAGASFDREGNPQPVLDAAAVVRAVCRPAASSVASVPRGRLPLLVIDDSLTTRMLEQSILETAGYDVDLAVSGEEALHKARQKRYAMFVVDVEMPGIDGFQFIERVQADIQLRQVPSILVTSRASAEDRRHGERVGARAYIVKSEFDEGHLLRTIRSLVG